MAGEYVKAKRYTTVLMKDGTSRTLEVGEPVKTDEIQEHLKEKLDAGDEYLGNIFEDASQEDVDNWKKGRPPEPPKDFDRMQQLEGVNLPAPGEQASLKDAEQVQAEAEAASEETKGRRRGTQ